MKLRSTILLAWLLLPQATAQADGPPEADLSERLELAARVEGLLTELDSSRYEVRDKAAGELQRLVTSATPERQRVLAVELRARLIVPETSFEVRSQVARWLPLLPPDRPEPSGDVAPAELDDAVRQLDAESYAARLGAASRLSWYLGREQLVIPVMLRLKERLADPQLSADRRALIDPLWKKARAAWLLSDPKTWNLPPVSDEQIVRWISDLAAPAPSVAPGQLWPVHATAERELLDILARDEDVPRVRQALNSALATSPPEARSRLQHVLQWTQPALVAEIWQNGNHYTVQHLLVDVPQQPEFALRVTHFDRIDDRTAHCVSGNSLQPGDYPVGVAIPHPRPERSEQLAVFFHLTNLPTPRRRLWYEQYVDVDEGQRLAAITRRTLERVIEEGRPLSDGELRLLDYLDADEISAYAGKYLMTIEDQKFPPGQTPGSGAHSRHAQYCAALALRGTNAAVPSLLEAIRARRVLPPGDQSHDFPWVAVLTISQRDDDPRLDAVLGDLIERTDRLLPMNEAAEEYNLGATAAAVLLLRHGMPPQDHGLTSLGEPLMPEAKLAAYRFNSVEDRNRIKRWWINQTGGTPLP
jgi:hypothetical protein